MIIDLNKQILTTKVKTRDALQLKRAWQAWYRSLSWHELHADKKAQAIGLDRFHAFEAANNGAQFGAEDYGTRTIKLGSTGKDVEFWQKTLKIPVTGTFDMQTDAATRAWQAAHNLTSDGKVGSNTWGTIPKSVDSIIMNKLSKFKTAFAVAGAVIVGGGLAWLTERK